MADDTVRREGFSFKFTFFLAKGNAKRPFLIEVVFALLDGDRVTFTEWQVGEWIGCGIVCV